MFKIEWLNIFVWINVNRNVSISHLNNSIFIEFNIFFMKIKFEIIIVWYLYNKEKNYCHLYFFSIYFISLTRSSMGTIRLEVDLIHLIIKLKSCCHLYSYIWYTQLLVTSPECIYILGVTKNYRIIWILIVVNISSKWKIMNIVFCKLI